MKEDLTKQIILFDGCCNLCNKVVQFIIQRDPNEGFQFASLQSDFGQHFLRQNGLDQTNFDTFILIQKNGKYLSQSSAALTVAKDLEGGYWRYLYYFKALPPSFRDFCYGIISKNRYRLFGQQKSCWLPSPNLQSRFLD